MHMVLTWCEPCAQSAFVMWVELAGFAGIMALGQMVPGPDWVLVTRGALSNGFRNALWTATGITCGLMVHATVALAGLAIHVRKNEVAWNGARWLAACYLLWIAFRIVRAEPRTDWVGEGEEVRRRPFFQGLICNLLNAKVCILLASVCAVYLQGERPAYWPIALWSVIVIQGWVVWVAWAALLQVPSIRAAYGRGRRWLDAGFAAALVFLAARLMAGI